MQSRNQVPRPLTAVVKEKGPTTKLASPKKLATKKKFEIPKAGAKKKATKGKQVEETKELVEKLPLISDSKEVTASPFKIVGDLKSLEDYKDSDFPTGSDTIESKSEWKSLRSTKGKGYSLFESFDDTTIKGGHNQYFLTAMANLCKYPKTLINLLESSNKESGAFNIRVYRYGLPLIITLDDYFPYENGSTVHARFHNDAWLMLLEKAWAKLNNKYANIICGNPSQPLYAFTGAPSLFIKHAVTPKDILWGELVNACDKEYIINGELANGVENTSSNKFYSVIACAELTSLKGKKKVIKIKSLDVTYGGNLNNDQLLWNEENKATMKYDSTQAGLLYLDLESYINFFQATTITEFSPSLVLSSKAFTHSANGFILCKITVDQPEIGSIFVSTQPKKCVPYKLQPEAVLVRVGVWKKQHDNWTFLKGTNFASDFIFINRDAEIEAAEYYLLLEGFDTDYIVANTYASAANKVELITNSVPILKQLMIAACVSTIKPRILKEDPAISVYFNPLCTKNTFGCVYYRNQSINALWERVAFANFENYTFYEPYQHTKNEIEVNVESQKDEVILFRYRQQKANEALNMSVTTVVKTPKGDLRAKCNKSNVVMQYDENGAPLDVFLHILISGEGITAVYINNTKNKVLDIQFRLHLINLKTPDNKTDYEFHLEPGQLISVEMTPIKMGVKYKYSFEDAFAVTTI